MQTYRTHMDTDRYLFDTVVCPSSKGWSQIDSEQDASYHGMWAKPDTREIVAFVEGDVTIKHSMTDKEFVADVRRVDEWNMNNRNEGIRIDPGCSETIEKAFRDLGLGDLIRGREEAVDKALERSIPIPQCVVAVSVDHGIRPIMDGVHHDRLARRADAWRDRCNATSVKRIFIPRRDEDGATYGVWTFDRPYCRSAYVAQWSE